MGRIIYHTTYYITLIIPCQAIIITFDKIIYCNKKHACKKVDIDKKIKKDGVFERKPLEYK